MDVQQSEHLASDIEQEEHLAEMSLLSGTNGPVKG